MAFRLHGSARGLWTGQRPISDRAAEAAL